MQLIIQVVMGLNLNHIAPTHQTIILFAINLNLNTKFASATFTSDVKDSNFLPNVKSVYKRPFAGLCNKSPLTAQPVNTFYDNS